MYHRSPSCMEPLMIYSPSQDGLAPPQRRIAAASLWAAIVLVVLDGSIVNVALPTLAKVFQVSAADTVWIVSSYQIALIIALLPCSALGESIGYRRVFIGGVVIFTIASALSAFAPSVTALILARFLQGLGGAAVMSVNAALLRFTYPASLVGIAIGWNAMAVALSSASGPAIGSLILSLAEWQWLFALNIPIGIGVLIAARFLPSLHGHRRRLDYRSIALNGLFFAGLIFGCDIWPDRPLLGGLLVSIALGAAWLLFQRERCKEAPMVPIDLLRNRQIRMSVIASVLCFCAQISSYIALPFYLEHSLNQPAMTAGLLMTPWPLAVAIAAPIAARAALKVQTGMLCLLGCCCLSFALLLMALWPVGDHLWPLIACSTLAGIGFGFFQTPNNRNMLLAAPRERSGAAGGMQGTARLLGQASGAVMIELLFSVLPLNYAPQIGLAISAVLALFAGLVSALRLQREK